MVQLSLDSVYNILRFCDFEEEFFKKIMLHDYRLLVTKRKSLTDFSKYPYLRSLDVYNQGLTSIPNIIGLQKLYCKLK